jgi:signal transduction histidine kinase
VIRHLTIRIKLTLIAVVIAALVFLIAGLTITRMLRTNLNNNAEATATTRVSDLAAIVNRGIIPQGGLTGHSDTTVVQIIDGNGNVVAQSRSMRLTKPLLDLKLAENQSFAGTRMLSRIDRGTPFRVAARGVSFNGEPFIVIAASSLEHIDETIHEVDVLFWLGFPLLVLILGWISWIVVGRALRPVELIRRDVESISSSALDRRVAQPEADDEVKKLAITMNEMLDRLETAAIKQRVFVANASHELRSPLATMRTQLEVAALHANNPETSELAEKLLTQQFRIEQLTEDLLFLAQFDEGLAVEPSEDVELNSTVAEVIGDFSSSKELRINTFPNDLVVVGNKGQLERAVHNLVDNAERHANRFVEVDLTRQSDAAVLTVVDDGPGIAVRDREKVFERFARLDKSRSRRSGGFGLGLPIVREIILHHRGSIRLSDIGAGACFKITLPLKDDD